MKTIVFGAMYNPMIHESVYGVISLHKTVRGAEMAIEFDKKERDADEDNFNKDSESWCIYSFELFED